MTSYCFSPLANVKPVTVVSLCKLTFFFLCFLCACQFLQLFFLPVEHFQRVWPLFSLRAFDDGLVLLCKRYAVFHLSFHPLVFVLFTFRILKKKCVLKLLMVQQKLHDKASSHGRGSQMAAFQLNSHRKLGVCFSGNSTCVCAPQNSRWSWCGSQIMIMNQ